MSLALPDSYFKNIILVDEVYEQWMKLIEELGSSHSEVAQHLLNVHERTCEQCKNNRIERKQSDNDVPNQVPERSKSRRKPQIVTARKNMVQMDAYDSDDLEDYDTGQIDFRIQGKDGEKPSVSEKLTDVWPKHAGVGMFIAGKDGEKSAVSEKLTDVRPKHAGVGMFITGTGKDGEKSAVSDDLPDVRPKHVDVGMFIAGKDGEKSSVSEKLPDVRQSLFSSPPVPAPPLPEDLTPNDGPTPLFISRVRPVTPPVGQVMAQPENKTPKNADDDCVPYPHKTEEDFEDQNNVITDSEGNVIQVKEEPLDYDDNSDTGYPPDLNREEVVPRMIMFNNETLSVQNSGEMNTMYFNWTEDDLKRERQRLKWREERRKQRQMQKEKNTPEQEEERKRRERERMRSYRAKLDPEYKAMIRERDRERIKRRRMEMTEEEKVMVRQRNAAQKRIKRKLARMSLVPILPEDVLTPDGTPLSSLPLPGLPLSMGALDTSNTSLNSSMSGLSSAENDASEDSFSSYPVTTASNSVSSSENMLPTAENILTPSFINSLSAYAGLSTAFPRMPDSHVPPLQTALPDLPDTPPTSVQRPLLPQALNALPVAFPTFVNTAELSASSSTVSEAS